MLMSELTNKQVVEAVEQVLKTFPSQYNAEELELLISNTLNEMNDSYDPHITVLRSDDAPAHHSRMSAVMFVGPSGDVLRVSS